MKIGMLHSYTLTGSGSSVYVGELANHLVSRGNEVHIVSRETRPQEYDLFRAAYAFRDDGVKKLFFRDDMPPCYSHSLLADIQPVAYQRLDTPGGKLFTQLSDQEIRDYITFYSFALNRICHRYQLDVLHANHTLLMPYVASIIKSQQGIPYVVTVHGSTLEYVLRQDERYRTYVVEGLCNADRIIGFNSDVISRILEISPDLQSKIIEIPNGVDTRNFLPVAIDRQKNVIQHLIGDLRAGPENEGKLPVTHGYMETIFKQGFDSGRIVREFADIRSSYDASCPDGDLAEKLASVRWGEEKVILYFGSLRFDKGIHCLIAAIPHIVSRYPNCRFIIAGNGDDREYLEAAICALDRGDVDLFQRLLHLAIIERDSGGPEVYQYIPGFLGTQNLKAYAEMSQGRLADRIIFTGYMSRLLLPRLLTCATLTVIPSIVKEAFPLTFVESLACGVPPVASDYAGLAPILDKAAGYLGDIGKLCAISHSSESMVRDLSANITNILFRLGNRSYAEQIRQQCRRIAVSEYGWNKVAALTEKAYSACLRADMIPIMEELRV